MAFDCFMQIKGSNAPTGESTDATYSKWIPLYSFSFGATNPGEPGSDAPGSGSGRVEISSFSVMKDYDNSSPDLFLACCLGDHFESGTVVLRKAGGGQNEFLRFDFQEVYIYSVQQSGSSASGSDKPTENVIFTFESVKITYTPQDVKGGKGTPNVKGWDLTKNQKL
jgi:type VI secretion system secreted protein Hcp